MNRKLLATLATAACLSYQASAQSIVGLGMNNQIFTMANASSPGSISSPISLTGMVSGQTMLGIDYRPSTGELYGLGYDFTNGSAQLYVINTNGSVTAVGSPVTLALGSTSTLSVSMDFNPSVDRIRVVGENGANYRLHPTTGAIVATDGNENFAIGDLHFGATPQIGAVAYTNSYIGASATTLYAYDELLNKLATQTPPNNGTLNTIGATGISVSTLNSSLGMDIYMDPITLVNTAYLAANVGVSNNDNLYTINLSTGVATQVGMIGSTGVDVRDIAVTINRTQSPLTGKLVYGLQGTAGGQVLLSFDSDNPRYVRDYKIISGITAGQTLVGMDYRPSTFTLYALGYNTASNEYQLYTINTSTAIATAVNATPGTIALGGGLNTHIGFDFNPVADQIRVTSTNNNANFRLNPVNGTIAGTDVNLVYDAADPSAAFKANIGSVAYTNSYPNATTTMLFGIDDSLSAFVQIDPPNDGKITTMASSILNFNLAERTSDIDFFYDSTAAADVAYLTLNSGTSINDMLYKYTVTGGFSVVNDIGLGIAITDIAAEPQYRNAPVSVKDVTNNQLAVIVYPNPATNNLYVSAGNAKGAKVTITNLVGKICTTSTLTNGSISVENLPAGMYILKLENGKDNFASVRFMKH